MQKCTKSDEATDLDRAAEEYRLIQRALAGDSEALSPVFARYRPRLSRIALSLLRNKEDAEDVLQDGLMSAYTHLDAFEGRSRFSTWLTRIVVNAALMTLRRKRSRPEQPLLDECQCDESAVLPLWIVDHRPDPEQACAAQEARQIVEKHMTQLSSGLRITFRLRELEGLSTKEAGALLGVSDNLVKSRLLRARIRLVGGLREALQVPKREIVDC